MGKPAARITDMHVCPMMTPGVPPIPHVGGPIIGPGVPTVLIGGLPAAVMGDSAVCVGPPDSVILGSVGVLIGGKPAARMGDMCAHGGSIVLGLPTVLIGETTPGSPLVVIVSPAGGATVTVNTAAIKAQQLQKQVMRNAAANGAPVCEKCAKKKAAQLNQNKASWVEILLVDGDNNPIADEKYKIDLPDGTYVMGMSDEDGKARVEGFDPGTCKVSFPDRSAKEWQIV